MDPKIKGQIEEIAKTMQDVPTLKAAQEQIEQRLQKLTKTLDERLAEVRSQKWDRHGRYRGVFDHEDQARGFGLLAIATVQRHALGRRRAQIRVSRRSQGFQHRPRRGSGGPTPKPRWRSPKIRRRRSAS